MRVELAVGVFDPASDLSDVLNLLRCFTEGRHDWVADPAVADAAREYFETKCSPTTASDYAELARKATVAAVVWDGSSSQPFSSSFSHIRVDASDLGDLVHDLCRAAVMVVEDRVSDADFLRHVAAAFGRDRITTALTRGWLEPRHAGGKDRMVIFATEETKRFMKCPRVVALLDSDSCYPGHRTRCHEIAERLARSGVPAHVLALREVENYVPNLILAGLSPRRVNRRVLEALKTLTPQQRGYFDMKAGFGPVTRDPEVKPAQQELYSGLSPRIRRDLRGGFGNDLIHEMTRQLTRTGARLAEEDFAGVSDGAETVDELRSLLDMVESVI